MSGSQYADFALLYRMLHRTRFPRGADDAHTCLLERWYQQGIEQGGRVRERLRQGVERALAGLGRGALRHPDSRDLRQRLASRQLSARDFERELLRLIYRLLFLMVAEERRLLYEGEPSEAQRNYERHYSVSQLRLRAARPQIEGRESDRYSDVWQSLQTTFRLFRAEHLAQHVGLHALNGELFGEAACRHLESATVSNRELIRAVDSLARFDDGQARRRVNYAALDVEELGSVYESLLDFEPIVNGDDPDRPQEWDFQLGVGGERKSSGSYYTPRDLVQELIGSALVPVIERRLAEAGADRAARERALLSLSVIDPAAGSGHFLLAAARRIARELARVRSGEAEPSPQMTREAMREVVPRCIYGVDKNPMAVDLCKVALWVEGHAPGQPLSFLDHHIKHGDSLVGVYDLEALREGIPDGAYKALTGDDKSVAAAIRKRNREERTQRSLWERNSNSLAADFADLRAMSDSTPEDVEEKAQIYASLRSSDTKWWDLKVACDLWTHAFFAPLSQSAPPSGSSNESGTGSASDLRAPTSSDVRRAAQRSGADARIEGAAIEASAAHPYFHWPLEFPDVFEQGGFDVVLGNPPWERYALQEREWFAERDRDVAGAANAAARKRAIAALVERNPSLHAEFEAAKHLAEAQSEFTRASGRFPLGARGQVNLYQVFVELGRALLRRSGRAGVIAPTGLATDNNTKDLFGDFVSRGNLVSLFDFENRKRIFSEVDSRLKFALVTLAREHTELAEFAFFLHDVADLADEERRFTLSPEDFALINPNTGNCPIFRSRRDAELTREIYGRVPVLVDERERERERERETNNVEQVGGQVLHDLPHGRRRRTLHPRAAPSTWRVSFRQGLFNMSSDSHLFVRAGRSSS